MAKKNRYCMHVKANGTSCGSPVLYNRDYCYFHYRNSLRERHRVMLNSRNKKTAEPAVELPVLEDRGSIQLAIMDVMRALIDKRILHKEASVLLYGLQLAVTNLATDKELHKDSHMTLVDVPLHPDDEDYYKDLEEEKKRKKREKQEAAEAEICKKQPASEPPQSPDSAAVG
jgi:hypothetical protein